MLLTEARRPYVKGLAEYLYSLSDKMPLNSEKINVTRTISMWIEKERDRYSYDHKYNMQMIKIINKLNSGKIKIYVAPYINGDSPALFVSHKINNKFTSGDVLINWEQKPRQVINSLEHELYHMFETLEQTEGRVLYSRHSGWIAHINDKAELEQNINHFLGKAEKIDQTFTSPLKFIKYILGIEGYNLMNKDGTRNKKNNSIDNYIVKRLEEEGFPGPKYKTKIKFPLYTLVRPEFEKPKDK